MKFAMLILIVTFSALAKDQSIDLARSSSEVEFLAIGKPGFLQIRGKTKSGAHPLSGSFQIKGLDLTGSASYALNELETGVDLRDSHMKEKYLETGKYPTSTLSITKLALPQGFLADGFHAKEEPFSGELDLHGEKRPVQGTVELTGEGGVLKMLFEWKLKISAFKIPVPEFMSVKVADEVTIRASVDAKIKGG